MKLLLTIDEYKQMLPVYGFRLPEYISQILGMTEDEYFQAGMFNTQRILDGYMQSFFSNRDWDLSGLDYKLVSKIKDILFLEFQYLHENQIWFEKTNDITYSTAGQQTFTFNTNLNDSDNYPLIPKTIKRLIKNTGILNDIVGLELDVKSTSVFENQFMDGYFVPDVNWNSKADDIASIAGTNRKLSDAINEIYSNGVFKNQKEYTDSINITKNFAIKDVNTLILNNKIITLNTFWPNKQDNDLAQVKDLRDLWSATNTAVNSNTRKIVDLTSGLIELNNVKVDNDTFNNTIANKANRDLSNVKLEPFSAIRYVQVDTNGNITFTTSSGDLRATKWVSTKTYLEGEAVYIENPANQNMLDIFLAFNQPNNLNKNPLNTQGYWGKYSLSISLTGYAKEDWVNNNYIPANGSRGMSGNLQMNGNSVIGANNLLTNDDINDNETSLDNLWSSFKTTEYVESSLEELNQNIENDLLNKQNKLIPGNRIEITPENEINVVEPTPLNISSVETYAGYNFNGKKVYVKFINETFNQSVETRTIMSNVEWIVMQNLMANKWASSTDFTPLPYYYGEITSTKQTFIHLRLTLTGDVQIRKAWGDVGMTIKGVIFYTKIGE